MNDNSNPAESGDANLIHTWAMQQIAPWLFAKKNPRDIIAELTVLAATDPEVLLINIDCGTVTVIEKPINCRHLGYHGLRERAEGYRMWFDGVVEFLPSDFSALLAICLNDGCIENPALPVFSFQKPVGNHCLLLPDPDMLGRGFPRANDRRSFMEKATRAAFAGGTSGGSITLNAIKQDGAIPRIRAALYFQNHADVSFDLPMLVQYENEDTAAYLRELGFGSGQGITWEDQLENKFILSMDGNGATCTRISIALSSNSVLIKYNSPNTLFYFSGLVPWCHYIPVEDHQDVLTVIALERGNPGYFDSITHAAHRFESTYLTRYSCLQYTAHLLRLYRDLLAKQSMLPSKVSAALEVTVHLAGVGDVMALAEQWTQPEGTMHSVEGFSLCVVGDLQSADIRYAAVSADGDLQAFQNAGQLAGTRGLGIPIHGFQLLLSEKARQDWICVCWAKFADGTSYNSTVDSVVCKSDSLAILHDLSFTLVARSHSGLI